MHNNCFAWQNHLKAYLKTGKNPATSQEMREHIFKLGLSTLEWFSVKYIIVIIELDKLSLNSLTWFKAERFPYHLVLRLAQICGIKSHCGCVWKWGIFKRKNDETGFCFFPSICFFSWFFLDRSISVSRQTLFLDSRYVVFRGFLVLLFL